MSQGRTRGCAGSRRFATENNASPITSRASAAHDVAVHHLVDGFLVVERPVRVSRVDFRRTLHDLDGWMWP